MIVEYSHPRYDLEGSLNTENSSAFFMFAHKMNMLEGVPTIDERSQIRFYNEVGKIALLDHFEIINNGDIDDGSPASTKVLITGSIITESPMDIISRIPAAGIRALGPVDPESIETGMARGVLAQCALIIVREFEGIMVRR